MMDWELFSNLSRRSAFVENEKSVMRDLVPDAPYYYDCLINNVERHLTILDGDEFYKKKFHTLPDETDIVRLGDYVHWMNCTWLVTELDAKNEVTRMGRMLQCNLDMKFKNPCSDTIYTRSCVLDSGVFSSTQKHDATLAVGDVQYKLYLPYDEATKKLYVDQRFATDVVYDHLGNQILQVYRLTAVKTIDESYGDGRLIVAFARQDVYNPETDDITTMICGDYRASVNNGGSWL